MKNAIIAALLLLVPSAANAQKLTTEGYILKYKDAAIKNMQIKKVPASITLAQGILESGNGNSDLAVVANNHFGIKCHTGWTGATFYKDDDSPNECFRKYKSALESFEDHADFLSGRERYQGLFKLTITDYSGWAKGLKAAGYATNPTYADQLISLIERYKLYEYDQQGTGTIVNNPPLTQNQGTTPPGTNTTVSTGTGMVNMINGLRALTVRQGQTKLGIATDFGMEIKHLEKYNELGTGDELYEGQLIFLEPKRTSANKGQDFHTVKEGETFYSIAQQYGMKTDALMKKNNMWYGTWLRPGEQLYLRKRKP